MHWLDVWNEQGNTLVLGFVDRYALAVDCHPGRRYRRRPVVRGVKSKYTRHEFDSRLPPLSDTWKRPWDGSRSNPEGLPMSITGAGSPVFSHPRLPTASGEGPWSKPDYLPFTLHSWSAYIHPFFPNTWPWMASFISWCCLDRCR